MRKMISVLMCFALLLSCCTFAAALGRPSLQLISHRESLSDGEYVCFNLAVKNCSDPESFELVILYNADVLQYSENYPFTSIAVVRNTTKCTVTEPGKLSVIGTYNGYGLLKKEFNPFCFKVIGSGNTDISVELVSFRTADGEVEDVVLDTSIENFTATVEAPQLTLKTGKMWAAPCDSDAGQYVSFRFAVENCPDFESFQVKITYNPEVLELHPGYPFDLEQVERHNIEFTEKADGTVIVDGLKYEYGFMGDFNPFCLKVIGKGDTDIVVELVSFKTADGEVEDVVFDASIENFTATENDYAPEKQPEIYFYGDPPAVQYGVPNFETGKIIGMMLRGEIRNCENLKNCRIAICYDPWVMEYTNEYPANMDSDLMTGAFAYSISNEASWLARDEYGIVIEIERISDMIVRPMSVADMEESSDDAIQVCPIPFIVYNPGETEIYAKILSWTDTDGNTIQGNVTFSEGVQNAMSAEDYEAMTAIPECLSGINNRYTWTAPENLTVTQVRENAPDTADVVIMNADQSRALADHETIGTGCRYCIIKNGETYFSKLLIVKNDLDGNGQITAEDARQALRFAVGLDTATDAQCRAVGISAANDFTAEIARTILRRAVGLDA